MSSFEFTMISCFRLCLNHNQPPFDNRSAFYLKFIRFEEIIPIIIEKVTQWRSPATTTMNPSNVITKCLLVEREETLAWVVEPKCLNQNHPRNLHPRIILTFNYFLKNYPFDGITPTIVG